MSKALSLKSCSCRICEAQCQLVAPELRLDVRKIHSQQDEGLLQLARAFHQHGQCIRIPTLPTYFVSKGKAIFKLGLDGSATVLQNPSLPQIVFQFRKLKKQVCKKQLMRALESKSEVKLERVILKATEASLSGEARNTPLAFVREQEQNHSSLMTDSQVAAICNKLYDAPLNAEHVEYIQLFPFTQSTPKQRIEYVVYERNCHEADPLMKAADKFAGNWQLPSLSLEEEERQLLKTLSQGEKHRYLTFKLVVYCEEAFLIRITQGQFQYLNSKQIFYLKDIKALRMHSLRPVLQKGEELSKGARQILNRCRVEDGPIALPGGGSQFYSSSLQFIEQQMAELRTNYLRPMNKTLEEITNREDQGKSEEVYRMVTGRSGLHSLLRPK